ncbi:MAG: T9SS type A sorting domain-containing protein, partial [candidate division Zixibacteria bacterium]|nr:T9SS type A sorting domain-containing protein [candidate division Zixibacteria bacterium]
LSVADLVYLIRVIVGDALAYPKLSAEAATFAYEEGVMSVDTKMGAAFVVLEGDVAPRLLADNMEMSYAFDGRNTRVLVSKIELDAGFVGEFLAFDANIVSVEMATYEGAPVAAKNVPLSYSLHQNYPNPFNPKTTIAFALPTGGDYSLTIYNVTGQKVTSFSGSADAGMVSIDWDAANMASGVYFYKLDTENFVDTKKMVLLK